MSCVTGTLPFSSLNLIHKRTGPPKPWCHLIHSTSTASQKTLCQVLGPWRWRLQAGTHSEPSKEVDWDTSSEGKRAGAQVFSQGTQGFPREVWSENYHPHTGLHWRKPYNTMSGLKSRKIVGLYTLFTKTLLFHGSLKKNLSLIPTSGLLEIQFICKSLGTHL